MRKIRELLRVKYELGRSHREIATSLGITNSTVSDYARRAAAAGFSWPLPEGQDETPRWRRRCFRPCRRRGLHGPLGLGRTRSPRRTPRPPCPPRCAPRQPDPVEHRHDVVGDPLSATPSVSAPSHDLEEKGTTSRVVLGKMFSEQAMKAVPEHPGVLAQPRESFGFMPRLKILTNRRSV